MDNGQFVSCRLLCSSGTYRGVAKNHLLSQRSIGTPGACAQKHKSFRWNETDHCVMILHHQLFRWNKAARIETKFIKIVKVLTFKKLSGACSARSLPTGQAGKRWVEKHDSAACVPSGTQRDIE